MKKLGLYEWSVIIFFLLLPVIAISIEIFGLHTQFSVDLLLKWFTFSIVGLRLLSAGIKQVCTPSFTAQSIFGIKDNKVLPLIRELGFANICFGAIGIISLFVSSFRLPAAVCGVLYFALAGFGHLFRKNRNKDEMFPMITDLYAFVLLILLVTISI